MLRMQSITGGNEKGLAFVVHRLLRFSLLMELSEGWSDGSLAFTQTYRQTQNTNHAVGSRLSVAQHTKKTALDVV